MSRRKINPIPIIIALSGLILGCQLVTDLTGLGRERTTATPADWPHSNFVPLRKSVQVEVGQALPLQSYHLSPNRLERVEIFVDDEPVQAGLSGNQGITFLYEPGHVTILVDAPRGQANFVEPEYPTLGWIVPLTWTGHTTGTFDLRLVGIDKAGRISEPVTQRIEVQ